ncbi:MAG TPA: hypothetical protein DEP07_08380 [Brevibacillus sp.]|nr:hypothetical protein EDM60_17400 [Brevibacillus parabrevis]HBZ80382.1 hypothetical protein [Brevibacillus sp.]
MPLEGENARNKKRRSRLNVFFAMKNVSPFFMKWDVAACGQQNGCDCFVAFTVFPAACRTS